MSSLAEYVLSHTERGECQCGRCFDAVKDPQNHQPIGHTADLVFFKVAAKGNPNAETLRKLVKDNKGEFNNIDLFDGKDHSYIEVGGWIGDQGIAMALMGLGTILGLWKLLTPKMLGVPDDLAMQMAGAGYVSVIAPK